MSTKEQLEAQVTGLQEALDKVADAQVRKVLTSPWTAMYVALYTAAVFGVGYLMGGGG